LEFGIGLLPGVHFLFGLRRIQAWQRRLPGAHPIKVPDDRERGTASAAAFFGCRPRMAFGMPAMTLSRRGAFGKCRKRGQLDILVFGMPKIYSEFF
jgi:hypothetical protein